MITYTLVRILAGDLPPRDAPGGRLDVLRFMLEHEPPLPAVRKLYLVNVMHDADQRRRTIETLHTADAEFDVLSFDPKAYRAARTNKQKLALALNINGARNHVIELDRRHAPPKGVHFVLPLDGECFFTEALWEKFRADLAWGQQHDPSRQYYSLPMFRAECDMRSIDRLDVATVAPQEPQLVFRSDASRRFDPALPWGEQNKLALLTRLGHVRGPGPSEYLPRDRECASAGYVLHLATCDPATDANLQQRAVGRRKAAGRLLRTLDQRYQDPTP